MVVARSRAWVGRRSNPCFYHEQRALQNVRSLRGARNDHCIDDLIIQKCLNDSLAKNMYRCIKYCLNFSDT
jgi:hypothetical protein